MSYASAAANIICLYMTLTQVGAQLPCVWWLARLSFHWLILSAGCLFRPLEECVFLCLVLVVLCLVELVCLVVVSE